MFVPHKKEQDAIVNSKHLLILGQKLHNMKTYRYLEVDLEATSSFDTMVDHTYGKV